MSLATLPAASSVDAAQLSDRAPARLAGGTDTGDRDGHGSQLRLVASPPSPLVHWRRRITVLIGLILVALLLSAAIGQFGASAQLEDRVAGHVVIEPGQTLWDVAADTAPAGMDTRQQLRAIQDLNGLSGANVDAWTVVLLPAR